MSNIPTNFQKSENNIFLLNPANKKFLYVNNNNLDAVKKYDFLSEYYPFNKNKNNGVIIDGYSMYYYSDVFENDCLGFAERLNTGVYAEEPIFKECQTKRLFGDEDHLNVEIGKEVSKSERLRKDLMGLVTTTNENANPNVGEAYAIVLTKDPTKYEDDSPFHIGYVLFKDSRDNITLEANAGVNDLPSPEFEIYGTYPKSVNSTFYDRYKSMYQPGIVVVLQNINVDDSVPVAIVATETTTRSKRKLDVDVDVDDTGSSFSPSYTRRRTAGGRRSTLKRTVGKRCTTGGKRSAGRRKCKSLKLNLKKIKGKGKKERKV